MSSVSLHSTSRPRSSVSAVTDKESPELAINEQPEELSPLQQQIQYEEQIRYSVIMVDGDQCANGDGRDDGDNIDDDSDGGDSDDDKDKDNDNDGYNGEQIQMLIFMVMVIVTMMVTVMAMVVMMMVKMVNRCRCWLNLLW